MQDRDHGAGREGEGPGPMKAAPCEGTARRGRLRAGRGSRWAQREGRPRTWLLGNRWLLLDDHSLILKLFSPSSKPKSWTWNSDTQGPSSDPFLVSSNHLSMLTKYIPHLTCSDGRFIPETHVFQLSHKCSVGTVISMSLGWVVCAYTLNTLPPPGSLVLYLAVDTNMKCLLQISINK